MPRKKKIKNILCICKGNICRGPMMEALLRDALDKKGMKHVKVESAGIKKEASTNMPADPPAADLMSKSGLDLSCHKSRWIGDLDLSKFDLYLCATPETVDWLRENNAPGLIKFIDIPNPWEKGPAAFVIAAETFKQEISAIISMCQTARQNGRYVTETFKPEFAIQQFNQPEN